MPKRSDVPSKDPDSGTSGRSARTREIPARSLTEWSGVEGRPVIVAGPCSAESEEQVLATARRLRGVRVDYLRAGIWKARTRPDTFEGIGRPALAWVKRAGDEYGLKTAVEVARAGHVEAAVEAGIDLLWLGARTTANPFSVQEIARALRGVEIPVLIKNPTSPDLGLWLGALERVTAAGLGAVGAIHRGVSAVDSAPFRNAPAWDMVVELRRQLPRLPVLCDPSHLAGRRDLIGGIAQRAMDLGLDGLMIEVHPDPDQAWSDAFQQITPERLSQVLSELTVRAGESMDGAFSHTLAVLREEIDAVDQSIMGLLAERAQIVDAIGRAKRDVNVTPFQPARWRRLLHDRMEAGPALGLDPTYVKAIYEVIHQDSLRRQSRIVSEDLAEQGADRGGEGQENPGRGATTT